MKSQLESNDARFKNLETQEPTLGTHSPAVGKSESEKPADEQTLAKQSPDASNKGLSQDDPRLVPHLADGKHNILIIGLNHRTLRYFQAAEKYRSRGVRIVGALDSDNMPCNKTGSDPAHACREYMQRLQVPHLGSCNRLSEILRSHPIDEVLVTLPIKSCYDQIEGILAFCEEAGVPSSLCTDLFNRSSARLSIVGGRSRKRISYSCAQRSWRSRLAKRALDVIASGSALAVIGLPMLIIAALIKLTSKGPIFFVQERLGQNHRRFNMLKFRTMVVNAEALKAQLADQNEMDGPVFKIKSDPRITGIGAFLRKFSLDELPQFINVLRGDMSLVGPRPPLASEVAEYEWWQRRRLSTRPGLTCFWQISGRNQISFEEWMQMDLEYIDNWSFWTDIKLILKTIPAVLRGTGAS